MKTLQPGDEVSWGSQSQGTWKKKQGVLLAILEKGQSPFDLPDKILPKATIKSRLMFDKRSLYYTVRGLVRVIEKRKSGEVFLYYTPRLSVLNLRRRG